MAAVFAGLINVVIYILRFYLLALFALSILRMVRADESSPILRFLSVICDPPAQFLLRKFPRLVVRQGYQSFDLSPLILMLGVGSLTVFLETIVSRLLLG